MADNAVKASPVEVVKYMTPDRGTSHSNEVIAAVTGDAEAVKKAVLTAREVASSFSYPWAVIRKRPPLVSVITNAIQYPLSSAARYAGM